MSIIELEITKSEMNPVDKFTIWYTEETKRSTAEIPSTCCLTSIGLDGYPNSRIVSLKAVFEHKFVITGSIKSRKGVELLANPKAALTFWWTETGRQVRIQGDAEQIDSKLADKYFKERNRDAQIVSKLSKQGNKIEDLTELKAQFEKENAEGYNIEIGKPLDWSGFYIIPKRIEFMEFKTSRFHLRELHNKENNVWNKVFLQP